MPETPPLALQRKRIRYRSWHRGCKETDVILGHFCDAHVDGFDAAQLDAFEAVLDEDDADIYKWLTGKLEVPEHMQRNTVLQAILVYEPEALRHKAEA